MRPTLLAVFLFAGCGPKAAPDAPAAAPAPDAGASSARAELDERMLTHFELATRAEQAMIDGQLDTTRTMGVRLATRLATFEGPAGSGDAYRPQIDAVRGEALALEKAATAEEAGQAIARMGAACGSCHRASGGGPNVDLSPLTDPNALPAKEMERHYWAANWMWVGLTTPSNQAYDRGLEVLAEAPMWSGNDDPGYLALQKQITDLSAVAAGMRSLEGRAQLYGQLLATCASCHTAYRDSKK